MTSIANSQAQGSLAMLHPSCTCSGSGCGSSRCSFCSDFRGIFSMPMTTSARQSLAASIWPSSSRGRRTSESAVRDCPAYPTGSDSARLALYRLLRRCHRWRLSLFLCLCFDILFLRHFLTLPTTSSFHYWFQYPIVAIAKTSPSLLRGTTTVVYLRLLLEPRPAPPGYGLTWPPAGAGVRPGALAAHR